MRKSILIVAFVSLLASCSRQPAINWPGVSYSEVRGYLYNLDGDAAVPLLQEGNLHSSIVNTNGVKLTKKQAQQLLDAIIQPHPQHGRAKCYTPRHGFVFYNEKTNPVAFVEICFECRHYRMSPASTNPMYLTAIEQVCQDAGLPVFAKPEDYLALKAKR